MGSLGPGCLPPLGERAVANRARIRQNPDRDDALARSAAMWLSVARQPLRAHELWIAVRMGEEEAGGEDRGVEYRDLEEVGCLDDVGGDREAGALLRRLVGGLVLTEKDVDGREVVYVALGDVGRDTMCRVNGQGGEGTETDKPSVDFSASQAHLFVARACMRICSLTASRLGYAQDGGVVAPGLVSYAWAHWGTHLGLSGYCRLGDGDDTASMVESMVYSVCTDALVLLLTLNDVVTAPVTFEVGHGRTRCSALVKEAQAVLEGPVFLLSRLVQQGKYSAAMKSATGTLEHYRNDCDKPGRSDRTSGRTFRGSGAMAGKSCRRAGNFTHTETSLDRSGQQLKESLAAVAHGLRSVAAVFGERPLHEQLLKGQVSRRPSPDVLDSLADWMETVASYPLGAELPPPDIRKPASSEEGRNPNHRTMLVRRLKKDGLPQKRAGRDGETSRTLPQAIANEHGISPLQWKAACLVYKPIDLFSPGGPGSTFTINNPHTRTSSFDSFPLAMSGPPPSLTTLATLLNQAIPPLPATIQSFYYAHLHPTLTRIRNLPLNKPLARLYTPLNPLNNPPSPSPTCVPTPTLTWHHVRTALLSQGYRTAFTLLLTAATLAHIRRILVPWLGQYTWHAHPLDDLRLAVSNPEVFMEEMLGYRWRWVVGGYLAKGGCDVFGGWLSRFLLLSQQEAVDGGRLPPQHEAEGQRGRGREGWFELASVGYLVWVLVAVEYVFASGMNTAAWLVVCYKLLAGDEVGRVAFGKVLERNWVKMPLVMWQLVYYLKAGVGPLLWRSVRCAARGQLGLLMGVMAAVGGVWTLLRYRSTFFIALEVSGVFVFLGYLLAGVVVLGREFLADPLGLKSSTALARAIGQRARGMLQYGADSRTKIMVDKTPLDKKGTAGGSNP
ncbi:hypothetical protein C8A01DRAFT_15000 [Parachaetomium inaequale]|uniref:Uncharacterized protein n=1 Tax=Parachaetomium inaequale TaxID=2588326 RepID=A0AAN6PLC2_9PEZI|nr:hypothetical protein C8A01DRAFT_15000 [Parachaetomium inaequale]